VSAFRDSTFGNANGATLPVGATGMQGLLTNSGVIHHSWDEAGCDRRPVARFLHR
jgi:hypothetical protein